MKNNIEYLIEKLLKGNCSKEELDYLDNFLKLNGPDSLNSFLESTTIDKSQLPQENLKKKIYDEIILKTDLGNDKNLKTNWKADIFKYAAIFLGVVFLSVGAYKFLAPLNEGSSEGITLEMEDGIQRDIEIELNELKSNSIAVADKTISYLKVKRNKVSDTEVFHTLRTPHGENISLILSDSSIVYLNAGSELKYPAVFDSKKPRNVFLKGEAYFEVMHDPEHAFLVNTAETTTEVLGTKFNVSSYSNETSEITLFEGKVSVDDSKGHIEILKPGQQAKYESIENRFVVSNVDAKDAIAWRDGWLIFENKSFETIIPDLERKYNVTIQLEYDLLKEKKFTGRFKNKSIKEVLETIAVARPFTYTIKDKTVIIRSK